MIKRATSNNLDVSIDSLLAKFTDGLEEGNTCDATNKEHPHTEELMADEFDLGIGGNRDLIENQQQKETVQEEQHKEQHKEQEHKEEQEEPETVNVNQE